MKSSYKLRILGPIRVEKAGAVETHFRSRKAAALLGYLASRPGSVPRQTLAALFWPEQDDSRARRNLSRELSHLRKLLPNCFETDYHNIAFRPGESCWVDTAQFTRLAANSRPSTDHTSLIELLFQPDESGLPQLPVSPLTADLNPDDLAEAADLYRGDFMADVLLNDCFEFENWLRQERRTWQERLICTLEQLSIFYAVHRQDERVKIYLRRWLEMAPWDERAHQYLMLVLLRNGGRAAALAQYENCQRELAAHLDTQPGLSTEALRTFIENHHPAALQNRVTTRPALPPEANLSRLLRCPFPGLAVFTEQEAPFFFGRENFIERLLPLVNHQPLVAVVGPSGSGKSSVVRAGLLPKLRRLQAKAATGRSTFWAIATLRPGSQPFLALARALYPLLPTPPASAHILANQLRATLSLEQTVDRLTSGPKSARLLLVIDEFEELYTLCEAEDTRQNFIQMLLDGLAPNTRRNNPAGVQVVLTLRTDFMEQVLSYRPLVDALQPGLLPLGPMSAEELRRAIEQPARQQGVQFEAGLVRRLQQDVGQEPGRLPLLQFVLTALWEQATADRLLLTHRAYKAVGDVAGALSNYAERIYGALSPAEQLQMQQIFIQLVQPGTRTPDTRRVALRAELGEKNWALVQKLINSRLVVASRDANGRETVEVIHEALIRAWPRWQQWLACERDFRNWQERLRLLMRQWEATERDKGTLLRGALLVEAERWFKSHAPVLSRSEQAFIACSLQQRN